MYGFEGSVVNTFLPFLSASTANFRNLVDYELLLLEKEDSAEMQFVCIEYFVSNKRGHFLTNIDKNNILHILATAEREHPSELP